MKVIKTRVFEALNLSKVIGGKPIPGIGLRGVSTQKIEEMLKQYRVVLIKGL